MTHTKTIVLFSLIIMLSFSSFAQESFFDFKSSSWSAVLKKSKTSRKPIFIQSMSDDCNACFLIKRDVWSNKSLGTYYSQNFLLYQFSSSKEEASVLAKLGVNATPTSVFVNGNGKLIHKYVGYVSQQEMKDMATRVLKKERTLAYYNKKYKANPAKLSPNELLDYSYVLLNAGEDASEVSKAYFATQNDEMLEQDYNIEAILNFTDNIESHEFAFIARGGFDPDRNGRYQNEIMLKVEDIVSTNINNYLLKSKKYELLMDTLMHVMEFYNIEYRDQLMIRVLMDFSDYVQASKRDFCVNLEQYIAMHISILSPAEIGDKCQRVADECKMEHVNTQAIEWIQDAISRDPENVDLQFTYIDLLLKVGNFSEARSRADFLYQSLYGDSEYGMKKLDAFQKKVSELEMQNAEKKK